MLRPGPGMEPTTGVYSLDQGDPSVLGLMLQPLLRTTLLPFEANFMFLCPQAENSIPPVFMRATWEAEQNSALIVYLMTLFL